MMLPLLVLLGMSVLFVVLGVNAYHDAQRSEATQHGERVLATVRSVVNHSEQTRSGTRHSATLQLQLPQPVDGISRTTAHLPYRSDDAVGTQIIALVDPHQPSYAELPGSPVHRTAGWVAALETELFFLAALFFVVRNFVHALRRRGWTGKG